MTEFTTNDRAAIETDGTKKYAPWSALCSEYRLMENNIRYPARLQAVWQEPGGDFKYFDGLVHTVSYGFVRE